MAKPPPANPANPAAGRPRGGATLPTLQQRLWAVSQRHPDIATRQLQALERARERQGDLAGAIDLLCQRFQLQEHRGRALDLRGDLQRAAEQAQAAALVPQAARVAEALGRVAYQQGNYLDATEHWSRALDWAEACADERVGVSARVGLGQIHYAMGAWTTGLRFHRDAATRLASLGGQGGPGAVAGAAGQAADGSADSYLAAKVALNIGVGHFESGQLEDAERHFSHGLAAARRGEHREFEAEAHWHLARAALVRGQLQWAVADCRLALHIASRLNHHWLEAAASRTWTEIALARGDEAAAIRSTLHGLELAERIQSKPQQSQAHLQLARLLDQRGELRAALDHLWRHVALQAEFERQTLPNRAALFAGLDAATRPLPELPANAPPSAKNPSAR